MTKKELRAIWDTCIQQRIVTSEHKSIILNYLKKHPMFKRQASSASATLRVKLWKFGRFEQFVIVLNGIIPLTKKKVFTPQKKTSYRNVVLSALRADIAHQILKFRSNTSFPQQCYLSGRILYSWSETHIDHYFPFSKIVDSWLEYEGIDFKDIKLKGRGNDKSIADPLLKKRWQEYHYKLADLRICDRTENIKKSDKVLH